MKRKKKVDPAISAHFRRLQKKSWEKRKQAILNKKVETKQ
jgi:hypothetical protein